jgi:glycosyltransferase involved in cell wall biosynthesis
MAWEDLLLCALAFCVAVQFFYAFYFFLPLAFHREVPVQEEERPVSVMVCAHNEIENLRRLLPSLLNQDYPDYELILVDDRSTDGTDYFLQEQARENPRLRVVRIADTPAGVSPKKYGLTRGVQEAQFSILLLTDADCLPASRQWIRQMQQGFGKGAEVVLGYSSYRKVYGFLNVLIRYETLLTAIQYLSFAKRGQPYMGVGRNLAYTRQCFLRNQGFASHLETKGGDDDLFVRDAAAHARVNIVISEDAQTQSLPKTTFREWIIQKQRHLSTGRQYKISDKVKIGAYIVSNVLFYVIAFMMLFYQVHISTLGILFGMRCLVIFFVYFLIARRLKEDLRLPLLPVVDLVYFLNYVVLGVSVLMLKEVKWK